MSKLISDRLFLSYAHTLPPYAGLTVEIPQNEPLYKVTITARKVHISQIQPMSPPILPFPRLNLSRPMRRIMYPIQLNRNKTHRSAPKHLAHHLASPMRRRVKRRWRLKVAVSRPVLTRVIRIRDFQMQTTWTVTTRQIMARKAWAGWPRTRVHIIQVRTWLNLTIYCLTYWLHCPSN